MKTIDKIKVIVAPFLKVDEGSVTADTVIDRTAIKGSIMIHRMYAALSRELNNEIRYRDSIRTVGDLLVRCGDKYAPGHEEIAPPLPASGRGILVGIDIEEVDKMPKVPDFREDAFYKENFSPKEISYCLLQTSPVESFAGHFAAKEAIVKADNSYKTVPFCHIEVINDGNGRPLFKDFVLSISHVDRFAIAVAVKVAGEGIVK